ncbi:hypothetical protein E3U43_005600, partial [Larimichthys crocea]
SCLAVGTQKKCHHEMQKTNDLSPNELSIKKAIALLQSMVSTPKANAKEGEHA